jgi:putative transposase
MAAVRSTTRPGAYNDESLIEFLTEMHELLDGRKATLIWDGLPSHHNRRMKEWVSSQHRWLVVEQLPGYAHDLNPIEQVWGKRKSVELANLCPDTIDEAAEAADSGSAESAARPTCASRSSGTRD